MSHNTWIHQIARVLVRPLVASPVTPNHVTTLRLVMGVAAAGAAAEGSEGWRQVGAGLFLVSMLLDRADGELARLSGRKSAFGHKYDLVSDSIANALIFIGLGIGLRDNVPGAVPMGTVAGFAVAAILWLVMRVENIAGRRAAELGGRAGFDPDDGMLVVPVLMGVGGGTPLLYAAAVGAALFAVFFFWRFHRYLGTVAPPDSPSAGSGEGLGHGHSLIDDS
ncbi:MAG: putative CDP-alcohol phosphatidyltransferase [Rhodospirillaceae bacterium]|nr:MAG: putative CDP-alcohol phosphatidyltransferase [Rhodospirillaceae bacterium]